MRRGHPRPPAAADGPIRDGVAALAVLGLARSTYPADLPRDLAATAISWIGRGFRGQWESPAPTIWPPDQTYAEVRSLAARVLPGARYRRHLYFRYSITWTLAV